MITISQTRRLDQALYNEIMRLWLETGISNPARNDSLEALQYNLDHGGIMLLAHRDSELTGTAWLSHDFRRLYIHHMAVLPICQNMGVGRLLLDEAVRIADDYGYQAKLEVHEANAAARHLYASCGFTDLEGYITMIRRGGSK
jgi:ribosomal protein S18 acetylase RimI-like enzyme